MDYYIIYNNKIVQHHRPGNQPIPPSNLKSYRLRRLGNVIIMSSHHILKRTEYQERLREERRWPQWIRGGVSESGCYGIASIDNRYRFGRSARCHTRRSLGEFTMPHRLRRAAAYPRRTLVARKMLVTTTLFWLSRNLLCMQ